MTLRKISTTKVALLFLLIFPLVACSTPRHLPQDKPKYIAIPDTSGTVVLTGTLRTVEHRSGKSCAEPSPDIGLSTAAQMALNAQLSADAVGGVAKPNATGSYNASLNSTALALAGRSPSVLLARDLTFRLCELSLNYAPGTPEFAASAKELDNIAELIKTIASTENKQADADKTNADANKADAAAKLVTAISDSQKGLGTKITAIVSKFTASGKVSTDVMKKALDPLVAKTAIDQETEDLLLSSSSSDDLRSNLAILGDPIVSAIYKAMNS